MKIDEYTEHFHIRTITQDDKEIFMSVREETSDFSKAYEMLPDFSDYSWKKRLDSSDEISMVVFCHNNTQNTPEEFVAICNFEDFSGDHVDLGYDVRKEKRCQGIGTKLAADLIALAHKYFPEKEVIIRVREKNIASQKVAEKCGGQLIGCEAPPEIKFTQSILEKYGGGSGDGNEGSISNEELVAMRDIVEKRKQEVRIYRMP